MDFLRQARAQLSRTTGSMSPAARIVAAAALVSVLLGTAWLTAYRDHEPRAFLMGRQSFSARQLRDMEAAFGKAGLVDYQVEGGRIEVPRGQQSKYMAALADAGAMPPGSGEYLRQAVNSNNFMLSGARQQAQIKIAKQSELQLVISKMPGVKDATVLIGEETGRGFPRQKTITASVSIEPASPSAVDEPTINAIRGFVANAWGGGLTAEAVTVVMQQPQLDTVPHTGHVPSAPAALSPEVDTATAWLAKNSLLVGVGGFVVAGSLIVVLSLRVPSQRERQQPQPANQLAEQSPMPPSAEPHRLLPGSNEDLDEPADTPYATLRGELTTIIRRDPKSAAGVLRTWIGNAS